MSDVASPSDAHGPAEGRASSPAARTGAGVLLAKVLLAALSVLISASLGEAALRWRNRKPRVRTQQGLDAGEYGWAKSDPTLGWVNREGRFRATEPGENWMTYWSNGRRASRPNERSDASRSVYLLGCSYTQGFNVVDEETFAYRLSLAHPELRIEDFGTGGYGTYQSMLRAEREFAAHPEKKPDLLVYSYIGHHAKRNVVDPPWATGLLLSSRGYVITPHVTLEGDALEYHAGETIPLYPLEGHSALLTSLHQTLIQRDFRSHTAMAIGATQRLLSAFQDLARRHDVPFGVVLLSEAQPEIVGYLKEKRIPYVDCQNPDMNKPEFKVEGVGHPNARQHKMWSDCIDPWLVERLAEKAP